MEIPTTTRELGQSTSAPELRSIQRTSSAKQLYQGPVKKIENPRALLFAANVEKMTNPPVNPDRLRSASVDSSAGPSPLPEKRSARYVLRNKPLLPKPFIPKEEKADSLAIDLSKMKTDEVVKLLLPVFGFHEKEENLVQGLAFRTLSNAMVFEDNSEKIEGAIPGLEKRILERAKSSKVADQEKITAEWFNHVARELASLYLHPRVTGMSFSDSNFRDDMVGLMQDLSVLHQKQVLELLLPVFGFCSGYVKFLQGEAATAIVQSVTAFPQNETVIVNVIPFVLKQIKERVVDHLLEGKSFSPQLQKKVREQMVEKCLAHFFREIAQLDKNEKTRRIIFCSCPSEEVTELTEQLLINYISEPKQIYDALERFHRQDIAAVKDKWTILRGNCLPVRLGVLYTFRVNKEFLESVTSLARRHMTDVKGYKGFFQELFAMTLPEEFRKLLSIRKKTVGEYFPELSYQMTGKLFFFETLCPYLTGVKDKPDRFINLIKDLGYMFDIADCPDLANHQLCKTFNVQDLKKIASDFKAFLDRNTKETW